MKSTQNCTAYIGGRLIAICLGTLALLLVSGCESKKWEDRCQLEVKLQVVSPRLLESPTTAIPSDVVTLCSAWLQTPSAGTSRWVAPREISWSRTDEPSRPVAFPVTQSWGNIMFGKDAPIDGKKQAAYVERLLSDLPHCTEAGSDHKETMKLLELARRDERGDTASNLGEWVAAEQGKGRLIIAVGLPKERSRPADPGLKGVKFFENVDAFRAGIPSLLVEKIKAGGFKPQWGRRVVPPPVDVVVLVTTESRPPQPRVAITSYPAKAEQNGTASWVVSGIAEDLPPIVKSPHVAVCSLIGGRWLPPASPTPVGPDGKWSCNATPGDRFAALLLEGKPKLDRLPFEDKAPDYGISNSHPILAVAVSGRVEIVKPEPTPPPPPLADPAITIDKVPPRDELGGEQSWGDISGRVTGVDHPESFKVVIYSLTDHYFIQPQVDSPLTPVNADGSWQRTIHLGTSYTALLVKDGFNPPPKISPVKGVPPVDGVTVFAVATRRGELAGACFLRVNCDKAEYTADWDIMHVDVEVTRRSYLRLYTRRNDGMVVQLLPNRFCPQPCIVEPGKSYRFPPPESDWEYRIRAPLGEESLMAIASLQSFSDAEMPEGSKDFPEFEGTLEGVAQRGVVVEPVSPPPTVAEHPAARQEAPDRVQPEQATATATCHYKVLAKR